jgi:hypothetical protein
MSASGTLFLQTSVFLTESRVCRACQEIRNLLAHGRRRRTSASGPSKTLSATVAGAWPSTRTLAVGSRIDCTQVLSCTAGETSPPRSAVSKQPTQAKTCQTLQRIPAIREIAVAAAHAEGKTAVTITKTQNAVAPMAANPAVGSAKVAAPAARAPESRSAARCQLLSSSAGGRSF